MEALDPVTLHPDPPQELQPYINTTTRLRTTNASISPQPILSSTRKSPKNQPVVVRYLGLG